MLDTPSITEAMLQASLLQQHSPHQRSTMSDIDEMPYDDAVMNLHNTILLQQAMQSSPDNNTLGLDNPSMLAFQDPSGQMWATNSLMPLSLATDQMGELQLQNSTANSSPIVPGDDFMLRRTSSTSNPDATDWQDKARTEVGRSSHCWDRRSQSVAKEGTKPCRSACVQRAQGESSVRDARASRTEGNSIADTTARPRAADGEIQPTTLLATNE
jgi:hypothetical protein